MPECSDRFFLEPTRCTSPAAISGRNRSSAPCLEILRALQISPGIMLLLSRISHVFRQVRKRVRSGNLLTCVVDLRVRASGRDGGAAPWLTPLR